MPKERDDIARRREPKPHHLRILGKVNEFVDRPGVKTGRAADRNPVRGIKPHRKVVWRSSRIALALAHGELYVHWIEVGSGIAQRCERRIIQVIKNKFLAREAGYLRHEGRRKRK